MAGMFNLYALGVVAYILWSMYENYQMSNSKKSKR